MRNIASDVENAHKSVDAFCRFFPVTIRSHTLVNMALTSMLPTATNPAQDSR